jgi:hypothetical protein
MTKIDQDSRVADFLARRFTVAQRQMLDDGAPEALLDPRRHGADGLPPAPTFPTKPIIAATAAEPQGVTTVNKKTASIIVLPKTSKQVRPRARRAAAAIAKVLGPAPVAPDQGMTAADAQAIADDFAKKAPVKQTKKTSKAKPAGKKTKSSAPAKMASKKANPSDVKKVRPGSKLEIVVKLLTRKEGCTAADVLAATGWPAVSMPQQARAAGITLRQEKDGKVTRYWAA